MTSPRLLAVELNDAGVALASLGASDAPELVGAESPGYAVLQDGRLLLGQEALRRHRAAPLHVQNRFWYALGQETLPWTAPGIATVADLAHAHLSLVLASSAGDGTAAQLLIAVPPGYSREQLGLLVGIANECGATVRGLVDLGLAACASVATAPHLLHLDLHLHQVVATVIEVSRGDATLRRVRYELLPGTGMVALRQAIADAIATGFISHTRFDPLHEAGTEQQLHDRLPDWVASLATSDATEASIDFGTVTHRLTVQRQQIVDAVAALSADILRLVQSARPAGTALQVCITPRVAAVPGLIERIAGLRDCVVVQLAAGAAAFGALQSAAQVVRPADAITLVHRLSLATSMPLADHVADATTPGVPSGAEPTHVLFRGQAWPITAVPLTLGWSVGSAPRALTLPAGVAGVSRSHCTLQRHDGQAIVIDHSTYGTFVNDERVGGKVALRMGDVLRLGAPGVTLELIRVLPDHGAA